MEELKDVWSNTTQKVSKVELLMKAKIKAIAVDTDDDGGADGLNDQWLQQ